MKKNSKRLVALILVLVLLLSLVTTAVVILVETASASSSSEIQEEIDALEDEASSLENEKEALEAELEEVAEQQSSTATQKTLMDEQVELTRLEIENTTELIQQYTLLIAAKQEDLDEIIVQEEELSETFAQRIRAMEETNTYSYITILFDACSFSDFLSKLDMIEEILEYDNEIIDELTETREQITEAQAELEEDKEELQEAQDLLSNQEEALSEQVESANQLLLELEDDEEAIEDYCEVLEASEAEVEAEIEAKLEEYSTALAEEEAEAARQAAIEALEEETGTTYVASDSGDWYWPCPGVYVITSPFGYRTHPITGVWKLHTGTDIGASYGTAIYAAKGGTVTTATYHYSYGNYVVINHGEIDGVTYVTVYAHMSEISVSEGDYVLQGEVIGYIGSTGSSTGPHLHFEIRADGEYTDPIDYYPDLTFTYS